MDNYKLTISGSPLSRGYRRLRRGRRARQVEGPHASRHLHQEEWLHQGKRVSEEFVTLKMLQSMSPPLASFSK